MVLEALYEGRKKAEDKNDKLARFGRNADILKLEIEIKEKINDCEELLKKTNECLREQAKGKVASQNFENHVHGE